jgi:hypothetical protein
MNRFGKRWLVLAGVTLMAIALLILGSGYAAAQGGLGDGTAPELEGTWSTTVQLCNLSDGSHAPLPLEGVLHTFARGGVTLIGVPLPGQGMAQGAWTRVGPNRFGFTVEMFWFGADGKLGRTKVKEVIQVRGDEYESVESSAIDTYPDGRTVSYCALTKGKRIKVKPPAPGCRSDSLPCAKP